MASLRLSNASVLVFSGVSHVSVLPERADPFSSKLLITYGEGDGFGCRSLRLGLLCLCSVLLSSHFCSTSRASLMHELALEVTQNSTKIKAQHREESDGIQPPIYSPQGPRKRFNSLRPPQLMI